MRAINKLSKPPPPSPPRSSPTSSSTSRFIKCFPCGRRGKGRKKMENTEDHDFTYSYVKPLPENTRAAIISTGIRSPVARTPSRVSRTAPISSIANRGLVPAESSVTLRLNSALTTVTEVTEPESESDFDRRAVARVSTMTSLPIIDENSVSLISRDVRRHSTIPDFRDISPEGEEDYKEDSPRPIDRRYSLPTVPTFHLPLRAQPSFASSFEGFDAFFSPDHKRVTNEKDGNSSSNEEDEDGSKDKNKDEIKDRDEQEENTSYHHHSYTSALDPYASMKSHSEIMPERLRPRPITITRRHGSATVAAPPGTAPSVTAPSIPAPSMTASFASTVVKALANLPDQGNSVRTNATTTKITLNGSNLDLNKPLPVPPPPRTWRRRLSSILHTHKSGATLNRGRSQSLLGVAHAAGRSVESLKESSGSGGSVKAPSTWKSLNWARAPAASVVSDSPPILPILDSTEFSDLLLAAAAVPTSPPLSPAGVVVQNEGLATPPVAIKIPVTPTSGHRLIRSPAWKDLRVPSTEISPVVSSVSKGPTHAHIRTLSWVSEVYPGGDHVEDAKTTPESKFRTTPSNSIGDDEVPAVATDETEVKTPAQGNAEEDPIDRLPVPSVRRDGFRGNYKEFMDESLERYGRSGRGGRMNRELSITDSMSYIVGDRTSRIDPRQERMLEIWGDVKAGESTVIV